MKVNSNILFLALIICSYIYSDIAHLEKQIAHQIIYHNAILAQLSSANAAKDPAHFDVWIKLGTHVNNFNPYFDKKMLSTYGKTQEAIELQQQTVQELKGKRRAELLLAIITNEKKALELKNELLVEYSTYNEQVGKKAMIVSGAITLPTAFIAVCISCKKRSIVPIVALAGAMLGITGIGIPVCLLNMKPTGALQKSITISEQAVIDTHNMLKEITQPAKEQNEQ